MARTGYRTQPPPGDATAAASLGPPTPRVPGFGPSAELHDIELSPLAGDAPGSELIVRPEGYEDRDDIDEDAEWREGYWARKCYATIEIYQHIEHHPNLVRFLRPDPWTWLPVFANPGGPHLRVSRGQPG